MRRPIKTTYNRIAGRSVERIAALSDDFFAVAMTLLVLDLHGPAKEVIHSEQGPKTLRLKSERQLSAALLARKLLYAFGASLCVWNPYASIGFIVLVQLNFALAPRIRWLSGF